MHLLDTDHISLIARGGDEGRNIEQRLDRIQDDAVAVSIISYEEQMRGWLAEIASKRMVEQQAHLYEQLDRMLAYYCGVPIAKFDSDAIAIYRNLWLQRIRVGTMDLKIAAIALANNAVLLTRNSTDFSRIPDLTFED